MADTVLGPLRLPSRRRGPVRTLAARLGVALALITVIALAVYLDRDGYRDSAQDGVDLLDAFYYATVSITTTGYGDVVPVTDGARLLTTLLVTPARVLFLILLVGTTLEVLAESSRHAIRQRHWRRRLRDHTIVCGYGVKGRSAIEVLLAQGVAREHIVVIDPRREAVDEANGTGLAGVVGDAARTSTLEQAGAPDARAIVVAVDRDDAAVLVTLTARELAPEASIAAAVRDDENRHLLARSGADSVITSSGATGRLLGFATQSPGIVGVLEDLLSVGEGLDLQERDLPAENVGGRLRDVPFDAPVLAVARDGALLRFDDPSVEPLRGDDRLVCLCSNR